MANPTGNELLTVQGVYNNQPAATTETFSLNQISAIPAIFGSGTATLQEEGNINVQVNNPALNPAGITNDYVMGVYSIPSSSFDSTGVGVLFTAGGSFANRSNVKEVKIIFNPTSATVGSIVGGGGTTLGDTGAVTNPNVGWTLQSQVFKYGILGSNTQLGQFIDGSVGTSNLGVGLPAALTANESASILVAVTGNAATSLADINFSFFSTNAMNN